ncbi:MoaD/ThiS family protein [Catenulispora pinisilvae]|uniref:MoaD/ThiS family protein n=1 Tax=Catenulispora pinisilvae TaxID=2705253 RepID=UPI0018910E9B|nr:MoaD/ThiS family protein [Catenulispora pinisilvae]
MSGLIRYWAAAKAAAGVAEEPFEDEVLADVLTAAVARHGAPLGEVVRRASFLVDGTPVGRRDPADVRLPDGAVVEVLPPFAGG